MIAEIRSGGYFFDCQSSARWVLFSLSKTATAEVREHDYAYVYLDAEGNRVFQYDDAPHHPELSTYPHHTHKGQRPAKGPDEALPLDIPRVDFVTILDKILHKYLGNPEAVGL